MPGASSRRSRDCCSAPAFAVTWSISACVGARPVSIVLTLVTYAGTRERLEGRGRSRGHARVRRPGVRHRAAARGSRPRGSRPRGRRTRRRPARARGGPAADRTAIPHVPRARCHQRVHESASKKPRSARNRWRRPPSWVPHTRCLVAMSGGSAPIAITRARPVRGDTRQALSMRVGVRPKISRGAPRPPHACTWRADLTRPSLIADRATVGSMSRGVVSMALSKAKYQCLFVAASAFAVACGSGTTGSGGGGSGSSSGQGLGAGKGGSGSEASGSATGSASGASSGSSGGLGGRLGGCRRHVRGRARTRRRRAPRPAATPGARWARTRAASANRCTAVPRPSLARVTRSASRTSTALRVAARPSAATKAATASIRAPPSRARIWSSASWTIAPRRAATSRGSDHEGLRRERPPVCGD